MIKSALILLSLFLISVCPVQADASTVFDLKLDMMFHGKALPTSRIKVKEGEKISITNTTDIGRNFVELVASKSKIKEHPGILIKMNIGSMSESGVRILESSPQVITRENMQTQMSHGANKELTISITAKTIK